ncbi:MAG: hypothetical protein HY884_07335 [Deltaproteobacteria bacterium]|nr:hypothetical protein [Deltaproteobacteria bacterium]
MRKTIIVLLALFFAAQSGHASAEALSAHGFVQGNYSANIDSANPDNGNYKWSEERGQLKLEASKDPVRFFLKADAFYGHLDEKADVELREGYLDYTSGSWDLRAGRQVLTWGVGDMVFINDVFPKDYEAFFSGRPMEYLKKGVDAIKAGVYPDLASFELVVIPFFEPNNYPAAKRFWMYDPMPTVTNRVTDQPVSKPANTELALRAYRDIIGFDTSFYFYKGYYRQPSMTPDSFTAPSRITFSYPGLLVYGASAQGAVAGGVASVEAGYWASQDDAKGTNPLVPNSEVKFLGGYQRQIAEDLTAGAQYMGEYMADYGAYESTRMQGFPKEPRYKQLVSVRAQYLLMHQTLRLGWFNFWSPTDKDYLINPEIRYNFTDHVWGALGVNFFGGAKDTTRFGSLDRNDNVYTQLRYEL